MQSEHATDALKFVPPAVVTASSLAGFRWDTLSYVLASIYTGLLIVNFFWTKVVKPWLAKRAG